MMSALIFKSGGLVVLLHSTTKVKKVSVIL